MTQLPYMPLYVDRLTADTQFLTANEFGAYMLLLCSMWLHGGSLPDDSRTLQRVCRCADNRSWSRLYKKLDPFLIHEGGRVTQKRLKETIVASRERVKSSKNAAEKRWKKQASAAHLSEHTSQSTHLTADKSLINNEQGDADAYADAMPRAFARYPKNKTGAPGLHNGPRAGLSPTSTVSATAPAKENGDDIPRRRTNDWDMPAAPGPGRPTKFQQSFDAWKAGDPTALDPLPGAPEKPKKETRQ